MRTKNVLMNSLETEFEQVWAWRLNFLTFPSDPASVAHQLWESPQGRVVKGGRTKGIPWFGAKALRLPSSLFLVLCSLGFSPH